MDILQRLPVEVLLRFKCISKNWYNLINSPTFIGKHFNSIAITLISDSDKNKGTPLIEKPHHFLWFDAGTLMVGPVDGVFLFLKGNTEYDRSLALWNPATRLVTTLPAPNFQLQPCFNDMGSYFGIVFDLPFTSNYKVVWVREFRDDNCDYRFHRSYGAVYSSSTDSWRILIHKHHKVLTSVCFVNSSGYLNGTYYWIVSRDDEDCTLLSFDFGNEVFREIRGPDVPRVYCTSLILRDGSINLLAEGFNTDFALWLMIEPGGWNKLLTFQCLSVIKPKYCDFYGHFH